MFHFREEVARRGLGVSYLVSTSDGWMGEVRRSDGMKGGRLGTLPFDVIGSLARSVLRQIDMGKRVR